MSWKRTSASPNPVGSSSDARMDSRACAAPVELLGRPDPRGVGGFDDSELTAMLDPRPLTTVRRPLDRIAGEMVRLLIELVEGGEQRGVTLPTSLVVLASKGLTQRLRQGRPYSAAPHP